MIVMISARHSTPSYNPLFEQIPDVLSRFFSAHSYMVVYPEQVVGSGAVAQLLNDQAPASLTWSLVSRIKRRVMGWLEKIQSQPKE